MYVRQWHNMYKWSNTRRYFYSIAIVFDAITIPASALDGKQLIHKGVSIALLKIKDLLE